MGGPNPRQGGPGGPELQALQNAYIAGNERGSFWYNQGNSSVKVFDNMAFLEAGSGADRAMAVVAPPTEYVFVDREVRVPTSTPLRKSKRACCIVFLVLVILAIMAAIGIGIFIYEANKQ